MNNIVQRDIFFEKLYEFARRDSNVIIITADMGARALDIFKKEIPNQLINVGIAEQNAISIASGLSLAGKKVFVYAIASFISLRCLEQIRVSNAIMGIPITIVAMGPGFGYNSDGPTHHLIEDISILRSFPNINIYNITDSVMAEAYAEILYKNNYFNYVRIEKDFYKNIYSSNFDFSLGLSKLIQGEENIIISTSPMTHAVKEIIERLSLEIGLVDVFKIPIKEDILIEMIKNSKKIMTIEEHFLNGGLGSLICEILNDNNINKLIKRIGIKNEMGYKGCYKYGGREIIRREYGIDKISLEKTIIEYFKND